MILVVIALRRSSWGTHFSGNLIVSWGSIKGGVKNRGVTVCLAGK